MRRIIILPLALLVASAVHAQQPKLTWIRYYQVQPGKEDDFVRLIRESSEEAVGKLMAEKKAAGWGIGAALGPRLLDFFVRMNDISSGQYRGQVLRIVYQPVG